MSMFAAIAVSVCNKATILNEDNCNIVVQQRYNHNFYWLHVWVLGGVMGDVEFDMTPREIEKQAKLWKFKPDSPEWESIP